MQNSQDSFLAQAPVGRLLLKFAVPCVLSMLVSALYNIVDQIFIGQKVGYIGNAATTVVYPFTVIALALALLIGDGAAAFISLSLGLEKREDAAAGAGHAIVLIVTISLALTAVGFAFTNPILTLFGVTEACFTYAREYMLIITAGLPFYMFTSAMNSVIRADGSPGYAMCATVLGAVLNLILDPVAIFALGWGVRGAALATVVGQVASGVMTALYFRKTKLFRLDKNAFRLRGAVTGRVCQLGISSFITQFSIVIISVVTNNMVGLYGPRSEYGADIPLSALGIVFKVFGIVIAFAVGIGVGGQPIVGYNYGAGNNRRVIKTFRLILLANIVVGTVAMLLFEACPHAIVRLFGNESDLYNRYAELCFRIFLGGILLCCIQKAGCIFLQSLGRPVKATVLSLSRDVLFLVPGVVVLAATTGVTGMLWAGPIADVLAAMLTAVLVAVELRALRRKDSAAPMEEQT